MSSRSSRRWSRRFAVRTTLWFTVLLAAAVTAGFVTLFFGLRYNLYRDADEYLEGDIHELVYHLTEAGWSEDLLRAELERSVRSRYGKGMFYRLYDERGGIVWTVPTEYAARGLPGRDVVAGVIATHRRTGRLVVEGDESVGEPDYLTLVNPLPTPGDTVRACQVGLSVEDMEARTWKYVWVLGSMGALVVAVGGLACYWIVQRPLGAVREMASQARAITARELHRRLPEPETGDELDDLAQTLNAMLGRLDDSLRRLNQFTGDAAHELRSPLTRLRMGAELALQGEHGPGELRETLEEIIGQTEEMSRMVNNLLFLAERDSEASMGDIEIVDCRAALEEITEVYDAVAEDRGVSLSLGRAEASTVSVNRSRLSEALNNLVDNAIKYTGAGGRVDLEGRAEGREYAFEVRDTGCGIASEHLPRIFDRFYRADVSRNREAGGSGLGLNIVQAIATAFGGRVTVESEVGSGSRFTLWLPLVGEGVNKT